MEAPAGLWPGVLSGAANVTLAICTSLLAMIGMMSTFAHSEDPAGSFDRITVDGYLGIVVVRRGHGNR